MFKLISIRTEQFASFEEQLSKNEDRQLQTNISFEVSQDSRYIACISSFEFYNLDQIIIKLETCCEFEIDEEYWNQYTNKHQISFPAEFLQIIAEIAIHTSRGILHSKTENSKLNEYMIPIINLKEVIDTPSVFEI